MSWRLPTLGLMSVLNHPASGSTGHGGGLEVPIWSCVPFVLMLLAIALLPLLAEHFWQSNWNKALIAALLAIPVVIFLLQVGPGKGSPGVPPLTNLTLEDDLSEVNWLFSGAGTQALIHELGEYVSFMVLLASLYTVSGGIVMRGDIQAKPLTNTIFLAFGSLLANVFGTTGASMLLIRPLLQTNKERRLTRHLPVFFIFLVSNLGGVLTPLGDPPLFLGFLNGVDFLWTLSLWPQWLVANGLVLLVFLIWDTMAYRRESPQAIAKDKAQIEPLRVHGLLNLVFLAGILMAVILQSEKLSAVFTGALSRLLPCPSLYLSRTEAELLMVAMALLSWLLTSRKLRKANDFSWGAITEVGVLFAGIFVTMVPALTWLSTHGPKLGITEPWQYFWFSGGLSSFLDNAPTYLTFATMAAGLGDIGGLMQTNPILLQAISCGAVFMGANTYIGNGPNFMVKAIADKAGFQMPSFFGYMVYSSLILLPVFLLVMFLFFWKF